MTAPPTTVRPDAHEQPRTQESFRTVLINSTTAAVLATGIMILLHELVHLVAGLALGFPGVLFPFGVEHVGEPTPGQEAFMALSAPVFSLVTGIIMALWLPLRRKGGFAHLLWLWLAFTSLMEGVGYLIITPFGAGDTAVAASSLGWPVGVQIAICLVGVGLLFLIARLFAPHVGRHGGPEKGPLSRQWAFAFWPWVIGTVVNVALAITYFNLSSAEMGSGAGVAIVAASVALLVFAPMAFIFQRWFDKNYEPLGLRPVPVVGLVALALLLVFNFVSLGGIRAGGDAATGPAYEHIWAPDAPTYRALPDDAPVDPNSTAIVQHIKHWGIEQWGDKSRGLPSMNLSTYDYSAPFWIATNADPQHDIKFHDCLDQHDDTPEQFDELRGVHIPDNARASGGTDKQLSVFNSDSGRYVDLWVAEKRADGWYACWGGSIDDARTSHGFYPWPKGVSASGSALEPYTIKAAELQAGHIDHVIGMALPVEVVDTYISEPATRTDGVLPRGDNTISEGQLLRLPADLDIDALNLHPVARTIAKAAQEHGFMIVDRSGGINLSVQNAATFDVDPYPALFGEAESWNLMWGGPQQTYAPFPWDELQALERDYVPPVSAEVADQLAAAAEASASAAAASAQAEGRGAEAGTAGITLEVTDESEDSFGFLATGAPEGAQLEITWTIEGSTQQTTTEAMDWWSGTKVGYSNAQATLVDADGNVLARSPVVKPV
ncbi:hypothetical protein [Granulicoccus sp. GXG6511]|uniref:hypothetical protein n=1 Tax=Granulicoccus sp. GXG6511 TaxID=3381351 RepID=UPI003D7E8A4B